MLNRTRLCKEVRFLYRAFRCSLAYSRMFYFPRECDGEIPCPHRLRRRADGACTRPFLCRRHTPHMAQGWNSFFSPYIPGIGKASTARRRGQLRILDRRRNRVMIALFYCSVAYSSFMFRSTVEFDFGALSLFSFVPPSLKTSGRRGNASGDSAPRFPLREVPSV